MRLRHLLLAVGACLFLSVLTRTLVAGQITISGREWGIWTEDGLFVIVAKVKSIERLRGDFEDGTHTMALIPQATLAGSFDASLHAELRVSLWVGIMDSPIRQAPPPDSIAIVTVMPRTGGFGVPGCCTFMPNDCAGIAIVSGMDDRKIIETLHRIQTARANREPSPYGRANTQPTSLPTTDE